MPVGTNRRPFIFVRFVFRDSARAVSGSGWVDLIDRIGRPEDWQAALARVTMGPTRHPIVRGNFAFDLGLERESEAMGEWTVRWRPHVF